MRAYDWWMVKVLLGSLSTRLARQYLVVGMASVVPWYGCYSGGCSYYSLMDLYVMSRDIHCVRWIECLLVKRDEGNLIAIELRHRLATFIASVQWYVSGIFFVWCIIVWIYYMHVGSSDVHECHWIDKSACIFFVSVFICVVTIRMTLILLIIANGRLY